MLTPPHGTNGADHDPDPDQQFQTEEAWLEGAGRRHSRCRRSIWLMEARDYASLVGKAVTEYTVVSEIGEDARPHFWDPECWKVVTAATIASSPSTILQSSGRPGVLSLTPSPAALRILLRP